jgi:ATP-dependent DNA ligase
VRLNEHLEHDCGLTVFQHACKMGLEGIISKRIGSRYRSGRSPDWLKFKNPAAPAVRREAEEIGAGQGDDHSHHANDQGRLRRHRARR